ncbi:hypothetical protein J4050_07830 [Winogradskyella sp. DF17]|uniref:LexA-binding, inner membrane-associated hydrolase n=1 Tax=Winogradskyella pelagia TaxID=2819984 RepID=A0ABS3T4I5_9FLAO|nr:DUF6122 family protein [Winogradskyella sp. DF17]MBO3116650.1 hypothetical protein [Winogradskyella sp. DF17]
MMKPLIHYGLHFGLPLAIAIIGFKKNWLKAYVIMLCAFIIDLDHLFATPIFDSSRCSINFHPLHSTYAIIIYVLLLLPKLSRLFALGLLAHIFSDAIDCLMI